MTFLVVINGKIEAEALTEQQARDMAMEAALRGAVCKVARVLAECVPYPVPTWQEAPRA